MQRLSKDLSEKAPSYATEQGIWTDDGVQYLWLNPGVSGFYHFAKDGLSLKTLFSRGALESEKRPPMRPYCFSKMSVLRMGLPVSSSALAVSTVIVLLSGDMVCRYELRSFP